MKILLLIFLICPFFSVAQYVPSNKPVPDSISIALHIKNGANLSISISTPVQGCFLIGGWKKIKTDAQGEAFITLPLDSSGICQLWLAHLPWVGRTGFVQLYAKAGNSFDVSFEKGKEFETLVFEGDNVPENTLLNKFERHTVDYWGESEFLNSLMYNHNSSSVLDTIHQLEKRDLEMLSSFEQDHKLDAHYYSLLREDIRYYYAHLFYMTWSVNTFKLNQNKDTTGIYGWNKTLQLLFKNVDIDKPIALGSYWYNVYKNATWTRYFEEALMQRIKGKKENESVLKYNFISTHFSEKVGEQHLAYMIRSSAIKNKFDTAIQDQLKRFILDYPSSSFLPALTGEFKDILEFQDKESINPQVFQKESTANLKELIQNYSNQLLYIDIWASWCGPCKKEFEQDHAEFHEFCTKHNIQQIYISIDDSSKKDIWSKIIQFYTLNGDHYLASPSLVQSLQSELNEGNTFPIPRYFIVNRSGKLVEQNAKRPSSGKALIEQIEKHLK